MNLNPFFMLIALCLPLPVAAQSARAPLAEFYAEVDGGGVVASSRQLADNGRLLGLRLGLHLDRKWSFEAELASDKMQFDAGFDLRQTSFALNLVQTNPIPLWNPYFLLGLGGRRFEAPLDSDTRPMLQVGVGGQWDLAENGVRLRIEARYRYAPLKSVSPQVVERGEPLLLIGLVIPLGSELHQ